MQKSTEDWRPVPGYPGYFVSDCGRVLSVKKGPPRILKPTKVKDRPYVKVILSGPLGFKNFKIHQLVMLAFVGPCPPGLEICHGNGDGKDNRLANLRYDTSRANSDDARRHGTLSRARRRKATAEAILWAREQYAAGNRSYVTLARVVGMSPRGLANAIHGVTWADLGEPVEKVYINTAWRARDEKISKSVHVRDDIARGVGSGVAVTVRCPSDLDLSAHVGQSLEVNLP